MEDVETLKQKEREHKRDESWNPTKEGIAKEQQTEEENRVVKRRRLKTTRQTLEGT